MITIACVEPLRFHRVAVEVAEGRGDVIQQDVISAVMLVSARPRWGIDEKLMGFAPHLFVQRGKGFSLIAFDLHREDLYEKSRRFPPGHRRTVVRGRTDRKPAAAGNAMEISEQHRTEHLKERQVQRETSERPFRRQGFDPRGPVNAQRARHPDGTSPMARW